MSYAKYITLGIDPGSSSGAITMITDNAVEIFGMVKKTEQQIESTFSNMLLQKGPETIVLAIIERVSAMPGQGSVSGFKFGMNYGYLRGCLVANRIPFRDYMPKEWQKHYSMIRKKTESDKEWKIRLQNVAQNLYPNKDIPLYAADSVLLAHFAKSFLI